ncbi:MAG: glycosyltransferase family 2 protein [Deltaproteobacteria bacterium]|nr:glycosyltransferase family 2 protein [Deltaproteobacteria bacterium]
MAVEREVSEAFEPFVTVVIRSFNRMDELRALVHLVLDQSYPHFELLVVDSSKGLTARDVYGQLATSDARVRVVHTPARGCPAAANEGVRRARGEIVAFVDDDDLPIGRDWLAQHVQNYRDPDCLGVNGFMVYDPEHRAPAPWFPRVRHWRMLSHGIFKQPRCYAYMPTPKRGIDYLMGGNMSIRREAALRGGGWDESVRYHNEHSLFIRLRRRMKRSEYLQYDPKAQMQIRKDVPGGLDYRFSAEVRGRVDELAQYFVGVVGHESPARIYGLFPLFVPTFVAFSAIAGYELAAGRDVNKWAELGRAALYAPVSLAKHLLGPSPERRHNWITTVAGEEEPYDRAGAPFSEAFA